MLSKYEIELSKFPSTYLAALQLDLAKLKSAIAGASDSSIIAVGSGASYTVASFFCSLHESYTRRVSRASTPLEIICNPNLAASSPVFFISAEGKNPDIIEALNRARHYSARSVHVLTNRQSNPLIDNIKHLNEINLHIFELSYKDGYLGTNSLIYNCMIIARSYLELDRKYTTLPEKIEKLEIDNIPVESWIKINQSTITSLADRLGIIVIFSPLLQSIAEDLESKLSESALQFCQLTDLRSFAHGRHLWLADRAQDCGIIAIIEPSLQKLWQEMRVFIPIDIPILEMSFTSADPSAIIAGLYAQMKLVAEIAKRKNKDPGQPVVPQFSRSLHYIEIGNLIPPPNEVEHHSEQSKYSVLGARWPSIERQSTMKRGLAEFIASLEQQTFKAIVLDYDGTIANSRKADNLPSAEIIDQLSNLINKGIIIGIATGRGGTVQDILKKVLPKDLWPGVILGLYNCGLITNIQTSIEESDDISEFLSHVTRIVYRLKNLGVPIETIKATHPHQVSIRFYDGIQAESNWFVIADALRQAGLELSNIVHSKHSIDILADSVSKSHLVGHIIKTKQIEPYQILTMGDQGAWPGNDSSLLEHRYSLSVNIPSRRLDRGWKLAPSQKRDVDATLWYLNRIKHSGNTFKLHLGELKEIIQ